MMLPIIPKRMGFALWLIAISACVPGSKDNRQAPATGNSETGTSTPSPEDAEIEELGATDPVAVAGVNLIADFNNTRARCDFKNITAEDYDIFCRVTITTDLGSEFIPLRVKSGLTLAWQLPKQIKGDFRLDRCQESNDHLSFQCQGQLKSGTSQLQFPLQISDKNLNQSRTETTDVLLPYYVGVIEGDFSDTHRSLVKIPDPDADKPAGDTPVQAGFFRSKIDRFDHKITVQDACDHDDLVVLATPSYLYLYDSRKDELRPFAGRFDENTRFSYNFEDPLRLNHQTYRVVCGKDGFTTFHAEGGWDIAASGAFSSAIRALRFDYSGKLLGSMDTLTDQVSGRVATTKTNRNLAAAPAGKTRVATIANYDGERFIVLEVLKSSGKLEWVARSFAPDKPAAQSTQTLQEIDITAGDAITVGLADPTTLARFVRDRSQILLYSGYCNYRLYDLDQNKIVGEVGPKKTAMTAPGSCADDTVVPGKEFSAFADNGFIFRIDNETYRTVDAQQQIKPYSSGTFAFTQDPVAILKAGQIVPFDGRIPDGAKTYPLARERMLVTNTEFLGVVKSGQLQLLTANNRLRVPEVGRINNIFLEASSQKILRVYNKTINNATFAIVEDFVKDQFVPYLEIPCASIVGSGTCAEYLFKTGPQSARFLITTAGANANNPDRTDILVYDTGTKAVTNSGTYATPRAYRYRNTRGESLSSRVILRHESQSTFTLFDANTGALTAISLPAAAFLDSDSQYSINDATGTLDLLVANTFASAASKAFSVYHLDLLNPTSNTAFLGLVSVPAAASGNTALPYTTPADGGSLSMNLGFQPNAKAFDQHSNLYFYLPSAIYMASQGSNTLTKLLDLESAPDCGGRTYQGEVKEGEVKASIKTAMKNLCYNKTDGIFVQNACVGKQGFLNIFIRQYYGSESANLTLISAPCSLLP